MKNSTKSVVFLVARIDGKTGGMERQALQLASALKERGCSLFFVTCVYRDWMKANGLAVKGTVAGFPVYRVPIFRGWRRLNALLYLAGGLFFLLRARSRYTIIHAHELHSSGLVACFSKLLMASKKVVIKDPAPGAWIGDVANLRKLPASRLLFPLIRRTADAIVAVSPQVHDELTEAGFTRVAAIPNGVDTTRFAPVGPGGSQRLKAKLLGERSALPVVLFVGRLGPEKNLPVLFDAVGRLERKVLVLIVGDGDLRDELQRIARERSDQQVMFWGAADRIERFYQMADVFVLPSLSEGLPNALLEAMSCGIPSIGSDIPGIRAVIDNDVNGYLFRDAPELAEKLGRLLADRAVWSRLSRAARDTIVARFSLGSVTDEYLRLYASGAPQ